MNEERVTLTIGKQKNIALIAHDGKKKELLENFRPFMYHIKR